MKTHQIFAFGSRLSALRREKGVSQKALALSLGVDVSRLCSMEKGRVASVSADFVGRACEALALNKGESAALDAAATHDRIMREAARNLSGDEQLFLSQVLLSIQGLEPGRLGSLAQLIVRLAANNQELTRVLPKREVVMS